MRLFQPFCCLLFSSLVAIAIGNPSTRSTPAAQLDPLPEAIASHFVALPRPEGLSYLLQQASAARNHDPQLARDLIDHARAIAQTPAEHLSVDVREQAWTMHRGRYEEGLTMGQQALAKARQLGDLQTEFELSLVVSRAHRLLGQTHDALTVLDPALKLCDQLEDPLTARASVYNNLGLVYSLLKEKELAVDFHSRAAVIARNMPPSSSQAAILNNLGTALNSIGRYGEAREVLTEVMDLCHSLGNRIGEADAQLNRAETDRKLGHVQESVAAVLQSLEVYLELDSKSRQNSSRLELAAAYLELGQLDLADAQLTAVWPTIEHTGNPRHRVEYYRVLSICREAQGDFQAALDNSRKFIALRDELSGEQAKRTIAELRRDAEVARKDAAIAELERDRARDTAALNQAEAELTRAHNLYLTLASCATVLGLAAGLIYRVRRRANQRIMEGTEQARRAAEQANELKTRLLAIASHDLKSPLRAIELAAAQMESLALDPTQVHTTAGVVRAQATRMFSLIRELIDLSALETGRLQLVPAPVSVAECLNAAASRHLPTATAKSLHFQMELADRDSSALAMLDRARFDQVLDNLIDNACKFAPPGSDITLGLDVTLQLIRVAISDQGPGFSPADYARVFQAFQTLSATAVAGESGSGLGLHIAREIIQLHGGNLAIDSLPGHGATLLIELPAISAVTAA